MVNCGLCAQLIVVTVSTVNFLLVVNGQHDKQVAVKWGVADSTATVGRLFRMHIPSDAFRGNILSHKILRSGGSPLPGWLEFDTDNHILQGIATPADAGQLYLEITAQGSTGQATVTSSIIVRDVPTHTSGAPLLLKTSGPQFIHCKEKEPETVATMIVDANLEHMALSDRLNLLRKFVAHMGLHEDMVKMLPVGNAPFHDSSALVSGNGDTLIPKTTGLFISWPVGCGQVKEDHFSVLQRLDDDSGSGKMAKVLGQSVIGWKVTNSHFQLPTRKRRQVHATPTPAVTPIVPTKTDSKQDKTDEGDGIMTHQVIVTQSPTFIQPTATQAPMMKTYDPQELPSVSGKVEEKPSVVMPTETMTKVLPVTKTKEMPLIKPTTTYPLEPTVAVDCMPGQKPVVNRRIEKLVFHVGEIIDYVIPNDIFTDCEVNGTREMELQLFQDTTDIIRPDFFIQFDTEKQKIIGLPMDEDHSRKYNFNLIAKKKSSSLIANTDITVQIKGVKNRRNINHELSVTVDYDFNKFMTSVEDRISLANKIASVYGDSDARKLTVTKILKGSVLFGWTNSSLAAKACPSQEITNLVEKLVEEDGTLTDHAVEKLKPFRLLSADVKPLGSCEKDQQFPVIARKPSVSTLPPVDSGDHEDKKDIDDIMTTRKTMVEPDIDEDDRDRDVKVSKPTQKVDTTTAESVIKGSKKGDDEDDVWITTVIPAIVIVVILLIALLIACILYRKKRKGKMNVEEQNTFINKGAPVIFPDELEDKPSDVNKPLLVEGSPAPPPEYHRNTSESPERLVGMNYRINRGNFASSPVDDSITEMPEKPYEPPPPVTASSNNKQPRTTHSQQPYSHPPQILP
ncbi:unnamed protein product [Candidula unifasciata]|uniref:Dystroglycan 1 n=1 Tax=Candidula unifasciata TaxID=100452 RepID=A0A8S3YK05_9EUPU|nr:unnamed protein product [Candidula unifasciata]